MRAAFFTLGCKVNQYETAAMERQFSAAGFVIVDWDVPAEVYVVNSCTVTASGDKKSRQMIRRAHRRSPDAVVALCGCFPQAFPEEAAGISEADIVMGSGNRSALLPAVRSLLENRGQRLVGVAPHHPGQPLEPLATDGSAARTRAFVKIEDGCERRCAYCIIPKARGPVRSKPPEDIAAELAALAGKGFREVVLVGINLSSYGLDLDLRLIDALHVACHVPGIGRIRLGSLEPELLSDEDIGALAKLPGLCPHFHLSLQSGCDRTLHRMRRPYDTARYRRIAHRLREAFPGCALTTDVMAGFPGETEEEFRQSALFVEKMGFARIHVFAYSARPGTPAAEMPEQVPAPEKHRRAEELARIGEASTLRFWQSQVGSRAAVLFEAPSHGDFREGYSEHYTPVRVRGGADLSGKILPVTIAGVQDGYCAGTLL